MHLSILHSLLTSAGHEVKALLRYKSNPISIEKIRELSKIPNDALQFIIVKNNTSAEDIKLDFNSFLEDCDYIVITPVSLAFLGDSEPGSYELHNFFQCVNNQDKSKRPKLICIEEPGSELTPEDIHEICNHFSIDSFLPGGFSQYQNSGILLPDVSQVARYSPKTIPNATTEYFFYSHAKNPFLLAFIYTVALHHSAMPDIEKIVVHAPHTLSETDQDNLTQFIADNGLTQNIEVITYKNLDHQETLALQQRCSGIISGCTGDCSFAEAISFYKLPFYETRSHKANLIPQLIERLDEHFGNNSSITRYFQLLTRLPIVERGGAHRPLSPEKLANIAREISQIFPAAHNEWRSFIDTTLKVRYSLFQNLTNVLAAKAPSSTPGTRLS